MSNTRSTRKVGGLARILERAVPRWADREDSEHEQAVIRAIIGSIAALYLLYVMKISNQVLTLSNQTVLAIFTFAVMTLLILAWLIIAPGVSRSRRLTGAITDIGTTTWAFYINGNLAVPLFTIYLWVIFGNGFRFGKPYLFFSMVLSIIGYCFVLFLSDHLVVSSYIAIGLLVGLIILPMYVSTLLSRLTDALRESRAASRAKSNFLAVMSHEIRTPLNGIVGIVSLLQQTDLSTKQLHFVNLIEHSSSWLTRVLSDGLDYSKIEADELVVQQEPFNLHQSIEEIAAVYMEVATVRGLDFSCSLDPEIPRVVTGDRFKLLQVLNNLLSNSCKFTEKGTVELIVDCQDRNEQRATVNFEVKDTGIGISGEQLELIFEPFRQADSSMARNREGTGLGLAISSKITRLLGGSKIQVESELNRGSSFKFSISFPIAPVGTALPESQTIAKATISWKRAPKLLLVEDNAISQEVLGHLLQGIGCTVEPAFDGKQAVELAVAGDHDLIFMDCQMPILDGYEATRQIRKLRAEDSAGTPIIALTANVTVKDRERCLQAGMSDYLGKPCTLTGLCRALCKWLPDLHDKKNHPGKEANRQPAGTQSSPQTSSTPHEHREPTLKEKHLHELRNCFNRISATAELLLLEKNLSAEQHKHLNNILHEIEHSAKISRKLG